MAYVWELTRKQQRQRNLRWPAISQEGANHLDTARRRISWYLEDSGRSLDSLTVTELIDIVGMGRDIWYSEPKGTRRGKKN